MCRTYGSLLQHALPCELVRFCTTLRNSHCAGTSAAAALNIIHGCVGTAWGTFLLKRWNPRDVPPRSWKLHNTLSTPADLEGRPTCAGRERCRGTLKTRRQKQARLPITAQTMTQVSPAPVETFSGSRGDRKGGSFMSTIT